MSTQPKTRLLVIAALAVLATPLTAAAVRAALPQAGAAVPETAASETATPAPLRLADNDDDEGGLWLRHGKGDQRGEMRRASRGDDDEDDDDDDDDDDGAAPAPVRRGPPPVQNPLIGAPRAVVN